jgi:threonine dehydrogenase-like Zn-dependent dehydrogenase
MRALGLSYANRRLEFRQVPEPSIVGPTEVLLRVREVGVCGTDRELALFRLGFPPAGEEFLILGHEALAEVVACGSGVRRLQPGDWVVPMVRRPCRPPCPSCARGRRDLCLAPEQRERGIFGLHGYLAEYAVDDEEDLIPVPPSLLDYAVLIEPLSVVEKAVETALRIHEGGAGRALILGAGPIGILAALLLRLRGLEVAVHSLEPEDHPRAALLIEAGIAYRPRLEGPAADVLIEAAGSAEAALFGLERLAPLGVAVILGADDAFGRFPFRQLIVGNRSLIGSVNAGPGAFAAAVEDLGRLDRRILDRLLLRLRFADAARSILGPPGDAPKRVHVVAD